MKYSARFFFLRPVLFFMALLATRAWGPGYLGEVIFVIAGALFALIPFRPSGYPAAYGVLTIVSAFAMRRIDSGAEAAMYAVVAAAIFAFFEQLRFGQLSRAAHRHQLLVFGYTAVCALGAGAVFSAYPGSLNLFAESILAVLTFILAYECVAHEEGGDELAARRRKRIFFVSGVYAIICAELSWALALLPIGYINSAGILGAAFFFSMDLFLSSSRRPFDRNTLLIYGGIFICVVAVILGLSRWTI